jgi:hypothetical protein
MLRQHPSGLQTDAIAASEAKTILSMPKMLLTQLSLVSVLLPRRAGMA